MLMIGEKNRYTVKKTDLEKMACTISYGANI